MTHDDLQDLVFRRRDGGASPDEAALADAHLAACAGCRATLVRWEEAAAALRAAPPVPSEVFVRAVMARVDALPAPGGWRAWAARLAAAPRWAWAAAGGALVAAALALPRAPQTALSVDEEAAFISDLMAEAPAGEGEVEEDVAVYLS